MKLYVPVLALAEIVLARALRAPNVTSSGDPQQRQSEASGSEWFKKVFFFHLAKTAGSSVKHDLPKHLSKTTQLSSNECCYPSFSGPDTRDPTAVITFIRDPLANVYSQWNHCKKNLNHWFSPRGLPANFSEWLRYWDKARGLSCRAKFCPLATHALDEAVLSDMSGDLAVHEDLATRRLQKSVRFVGLTEYYQESMCILHAMSKNSLPPYCNCEDREAWDKFLHENRDHGSGGTKSHTLSTADADIIRKLTKVDARLYEVAMDRFMELVHSVEERFGKRVFCRGPVRTSLEGETIQLFDWDEADA